MGAALDTAASKHANWLLGMLLAITCHATYTTAFYDVIVTVQPTCMALEQEHRKLVRCGWLELRLQCWNE